MADVNNNKCISINFSKQVVVVVATVCNLIVLQMYQHHLR